MTSRYWIGLVGLAMCSGAMAEGVQFDPAKVVGSQTCIECHVNESEAWKKTPHHTTWDQLHTRETAKAIAEKMGVRSIKRGDVCIQCHYTRQESEGAVKPVSGVSCESCHGPARDWIKLHNDYGGPDVKKEQETAEHKAGRIKKAMEAGMLHPSDAYLVAQNCYNCHTVPNESLVNTGGHKAGSEGFELVAWSQGMVRHNFHRTGGQSNAPSEPQRLRVLYVIGTLTDFEYSIRGIAKATAAGDYTKSMVGRYKAANERLAAIAAKAPIPQVAKALEIADDLKTNKKVKLNNPDELLKAADAVQEAARQFSQAADGAKLAALDELLPKPEQYKTQPSQ